MPSVDVLLRLVNNFMVLWATSDSVEQHTIARAWSKIAAAYQDCMWHRVRASISAVIATLKQAGIQPAWPTNWVFIAGVILNWNASHASKAAALWP